jgi:hypothetical protein
MAGEMEWNYKMPDVDVIHGVVRDLYSNTYGTPPGITVEEIDTVKAGQEIYTGVMGMSLLDSLPLKSFLVVFLFLAAEQLVAPPWSVETMPVDYNAVRTAVVQTQCETVHAEINGVGRWLKRGTFRDVVSGAKYGFSIDELSKIGASLRDGDKYVLVFRLPEGQTLNETHIVWLRRFCSGTNAGFEDDTAFVGGDLSELMAYWGNPDLIEGSETSVARKAPLAVVMTFREKNRRVLVSRDAKVLRIEAMEPPEGGTTGPAISNTQ